MYGNLSRFWHFNPRSPHGERQQLKAVNNRDGYFNPRSPHGERHDACILPDSCFRFQSTLPARGATETLLNCTETAKISIHAPRTGSDCDVHEFFGVAVISIHAPRTGSDQILRAVLGAVLISIHAPRTGSDIPPSIVLPPFSNFNPRSPHGERRCTRSFTFARPNFNPRSPHGERPFSDSPLSHAVTFQSTLPARGATSGSVVSHIHPVYFNPRSPHGERPLRRGLLEAGAEISIHAPRTGSDQTYREDVQMTFEISIHAPRMGSDYAPRKISLRSNDFNPRSPHGERLTEPLFEGWPGSISIHAPRTGSDMNAYVCSNRGDISIHAPRTGSDPCG